MAYLIDTNVISEIQKGPKADAGVSGWYQEVSPNDIYLSVMVLGEIRQGVELLRKRDNRQADILDQRMKVFVNAMNSRILPVTLKIALRWADNNVPDRLPVIDGLLAATALEHDLTLVTRNVKDVERTGVRLLNPFAAK